MNEIEMMITAYARVCLAFFTATLLFAVEPTIVTPSAADYRTAQEARIKDASTEPGNFDAYLSAMQLFLVKKRPFEASDYDALIASASTAMSIALPDDANLTCRIIDFKIKVATTILNRQPGWDALDRRTANRIQAEALQAVRPLLVSITADEPAAETHKSGPLNIVYLGNDPAIRAETERAMQENDKRNQAARYRQMTTNNREVLASTLRRYFTVNLAIPIDDENGVTAYLQKVGMTQAQAEAVFTKIIKK